MAITKYDLDINKQAIIKPVVILRQGDHDIDTMQVSLSVANEPMDLTGATVTFMGNTANGRQIIDDAHVKIIDAKSGVFEYVFPSEASSDIGEYKVAYFSIILANGQSSTMDFRVQVLSGVDISAPVASEYISHYDTMVSELNSAYDSFVNETDDKMASTVSSLATSAATVLDSALARVNDVDSKANHASSVAADAVSMASSVASDVTSQASYINSVASSAASNVSSVAAGVVDKLNNISVGGRNLLLDTGRSFTGIGINSTNGNFDAQGGQYYLAGGKKVSDLYNQYGPSQYLTVSFDWEASGDNISGKFAPQWSGTPWIGLADGGGIEPSNTNKSGHFKSSVQLNRGGYSTGIAISVQFRQDNLQGNVTIKNMKLEAGNVPTDWTPAPEDADNTFLKKSNQLPAEARDFNYLANHMQTYQGAWYNRSESVANAPDGNWTYSVIEVIAGNAETTGVIRTARFGSSVTYSANVNGGAIQYWTLIADDANVVHKTGNEVIAGDKTLAGKVIADNFVSNNVPVNLTKTTTSEMWYSSTLTASRTGNTVTIVNYMQATNTIPDNNTSREKIPAGYRPSTVLYYPAVYGSSLKGELQINPDGTFTARGAINGQYRVTATYITGDAWPV